MAFKLEIPQWVNNHTRLNETNMNKIRDVLIDFKKTLYGTNDAEPGGLTLLASNHDKLLNGSRFTTDAIKYWGLKSQVKDLGKIVLSSAFDVEYTDAWNEVKLQSVLSHPTSIPDLTTDTSKIAWGVSSGDGRNPYKELSLQNNTVTGNDDSYFDQFAKVLTWQFDRVLSIGKTYAPNKITLNYPTAVGAAEGPYICATNEGSTPSLQIIAPTYVSGALEHKIALKVNTASGTEPIVWASNISVSNDRTLSETSVVTLGTEKNFADLTDYDKCTLIGERIQREAADNAIQLAIISEVEARRNKDEELEAGYKTADAELRETIIGDVNDTIDDDTLNGVINYANKEISSLNNSLNFFAEEPVTTLPSATMSIDKSSIEVGSTFNQVKVTGITFNPGAYTYGSVDMENDTTPKTDANGYYTYKEGTGLLSTSYTYSCTGKIDKNSGTDVTLTVNDRTLSCSNQLMLDNDKLIVYCSISHNAGDLPVDSIGRIVESKRIAANSVSQLSKTITTYRKPFWGYKLTPDALSNPQSITSSQIRSLQKSGTSASNLPTTYEVPANTKQIFFAAKQGTKTNLTIKNTTKEPATTVACSKISVNVADARGGSNNTTPYDVWYVNPDSAFTTLTKLQLTWS